MSEERLVKVALRAGATRQSFTRPRRPGSRRSTRAASSRRGGWCTGEGATRVSVEFPAEILSDGVQVVALRSTVTGAVLDRVTLLAGDALDEDIRAEVALLRDELEMLKRAFRRHVSAQVVTMPSNLQFSARSFADEDYAKEAMYKLHSVLSVISQSIDLTNLDGVTVAFDYDEALAELDRGYETT
jgi:hypothetical protein